MTVCGIEAYYHNFSLDPAIRWLFGLQTPELGKQMRTVFPFGWSQAPYLASTVTAELAASVRATGISVEAMIDDFITVGMDEATGRHCQQQLHTTLAKTGLKLCIDKDQFGQQVTYIGYHVDTERMTVRIPPISAKGFHLCLQRYRDLISRGQHIPAGTMRHVCGKLNDYGKVAQVSLCWTYLKHGASMSPRGI